MATDRSACVVPVLQCGALTDIQVRVHEAGTVFETGWLPGGAAKVAVAVTGAGNREAAVMTERAINLFRPFRPLFVGVAGALHTDLELGDVVVATKVYAYQAGEDDDEGFGARPSAWPAPHELEQLARRVHRDSSWRTLLAPEAQPGGKTGARVSAVYRFRHVCWIGCAEF
jgi:nucleoside phosphorylase